MIPPESNPSTPLMWFASFLVVAACLLSVFAVVFR